MDIGCRQRRRTASRCRYYAGGTWDFVKNGYARLDDQYADDVFNTFYVDGKYPIAIDDKTLVTLGAQYIHQKSVGAAQIGELFDQRDRPAGSGCVRGFRRLPRVHADESGLRHPRTRTATTRRIST